MQGGKAMIVDTEIVQTMEQMPEDLKHKLLHYTEYLIANGSIAILRSW